jgi:hypothetical protein
MALPRKGSDPSDNFDASELIASRDSHEKGISELNERVTSMESKLKTPQDLATFFEGASKDSRVLDGVFASMFCRFMKENDQVREAVDKRMEEVDRKFIHKFMKRGWIVLYTIGVFVVSKLSDALGEYLKSLLIHKP